MAEWWSGSTIDIYFSNESSKNLWRKQQSLVVCNHRSEVDLIFQLMFLDKFNALDTYKCLCKKELKFVPIIGWNFFFSEYIFLERNWEKDSKIIVEGLDRFMDHKKVFFGITAEGTRFTPEKYKNSIKFAKDKGLYYKHHLMPRVKGFTHCVQHFKKNNPNCILINLELALDESNGSDIRISDLIQGIPIKGSFYMKCIPLSDIPTDTDEQINSYLYKLFEEKDKLMEYFIQNKKFPGIRLPFKRSSIPLIVLLINFCIVGISFLYFLLKVLTSGNLILITITLIFIITVNIGVYFAIHSTKVFKESTYAKESK